VVHKGAGTANNGDNDAWEPIAPLIRDPGEAGGPHLRPRCRSRCWLGTRPPVDTHATLSPASRCSDRPHLPSYCRGAQSTSELPRKPASGTAAVGEEAASAVDPAVLDHCRQRADSQKLKEGPERKAFMGTCVTPED
jgi:hypothetical protein